MQDNKRHAFSGVPFPSAEPSGFGLFQLVLGLFRKIQMLLDHFCCIVGKLLHVSIAPAVCLLLKLGQVLSD
jgi:hypothetical protein